MKITTNGLVKGIMNRFISKQLKNNVLSNIYFINQLSLSSINQCVNRMIRDILPTSGKTRIVTSFFKSGIKTPAEISATEATETVSSEVILKSTSSLLVGAIFQIAACVTGKCRFSAYD